MLTYVWRIGLSLGLVLALSVGGGLRAADSLAVAQPVAGGVATPGAEEATLRLSAGGHLVGFAPSGWNLTNGQYALGVTFVAASSVPPQHLAGVVSTPAPRKLAQRGPAPLARLEYRNLWAGITLAYAADAAGIMRSTYTLAPKADVSAIRLRYNVPVALAADGGLRLAFANGDMYETAPIAWQEVAGQRQAITVEFVQHSENEIGFALGQHDPSRPVVIDPLLRWNTFLGGTSYDSVEDMTVDGSGNVYVTGYSGATWGTPVQAFSTGPDAYLAKLNANGAIVWHTFIGGTASDYGYAVETDTSNNVYVSGISYGTWGSPMRAYSGGGDTFVARFSAADGVRAWNTFLGSTSSDESIFGLEVDASGNVYVSGESIAVWGTPVVTHTVGGSYDPFIARLTSAGALTWNTFMGSTDTDWGIDLATDGTYLYVTGVSFAAWGSPVRPYSAGADAFVARVTASNGAFGWNTFLGGTGDDRGWGIAASGSALYIAGQSDAAWGTPVRAYSNPGMDAFAARITNLGALTWNTFFGSSDITIPPESNISHTPSNAATPLLDSGPLAGNAGDYAFRISTDANNNVYVFGYSFDSWGLPLRRFSVGPDVFVVRLNGANGAWGWQTFLGGNGSDGDYLAGGIATYSTNVYAAGNSTASWGLPIRAFSGGSDTFVARLNAGFETYLPMPIRAITMALPLSQSFNSGVMPPTNWSVVQTGGTTWVAGNNQGQWDTYGAYAAAAAQNEVLMSPLFTVGTAQLKFYARGSRTACVTNNACDVNVWLVKGSGWGGGDDVLLYNAESDWTGDFQWVLTTVNIPANFETVRVAIQYVNNNAAGVVIDDITVTP